MIVGLAAEGRPLDVWEQRWAPYDEQTYANSLAYIRPTDIVMDIGAGDFRFAQKAAAKARLVYGVENQKQFFPPEVTHPNLFILHADARTLTFPTGITVGVLLMRHCRHFYLYFEKLKQAGARRLITNARWGMGVEEIDLFRERTHYRDIDLGWYACVCGRAGFKPGPADQLTPYVDAYIHEVVDCPGCQSTGV